MGPWPPLVEKPTIEYLKKEKQADYTQSQIRVQVAPDRTSDDAYLLVPEGPRGPFPAVIVVFYDGLSGLGGGRGAGKHYDFARQLVKRGFVTLSFGSDPNTYYLNKQHAQLQPISYNAVYGGQLVQRLGVVADSRSAAGRHYRPIVRWQVGHVCLLPQRALCLRGMVRP